MFASLPPTTNEPIVRLIAIYTDTPEHVPFSPFIVIQLPLSLFCFYIIIGLPFYELFIYLKIFQDINDTFYRVSRLFILNYGLKEDNAFTPLLALYLVKMHI